MKFYIRFASLLLIIFGAVNCTRTTKPATTEVPATIDVPAVITQESDNQLSGQWNLQAIKQENLALRPGTMLSITQKDYSLYAGCNTIFGAIQVGKNEVKLFEGGSTAMACDGMQYEQKLSELLFRMSEYKVKGEEMTMKTPDGASLTWKKVTASNQLVGKKLKVVGLSDKGAVLSSANAPKQFLNFQAGGNMTGSGGCNYINGTYEILGNQLHLRGLMSSRMACAEPEKQAYEGALIAHLNNAPLTIEVSGDMITLRDKSGAIAVQLMPE